MSFLSSCQDNPSGFEYADFIFFKDISINGKRLYTARAIEIIPQDGEINWGGDSNFPRPIFGWKSISLDKLMVTADEALSMAEEIGGKIGRLSIQNECQINVEISPEKYDYAGWRVSYGGIPSLSDDFILIPTK